jgi:hypothetical protein
MNTTLLPEALSSVFDVSEGLVGDGAAGACTAGAADDFEAVRLWTSASRLREALARVSEMLANCCPSMPVIAAGLAMGCCYTTICCAVLCGSLVSWHI